MCHGRMLPIRTCCGVTARKAEACSAWRIFSKVGALAHLLYEGALERTFENLCLATARALMVEEDTVHRKHVVRLPARYEVSGGLVNVLT